MNSLSFAKFIHPQQIFKPTHPCTHPHAFSSHTQSLCLNAISSASSQSKDHIQGSLSFRLLHYRKGSGKRKLIQNNQMKWLLTCYISISSLCFHSQSAVLQGRKVHPQRFLSVSTIKWLNLLKALSSCPFYCCCNHCLEKHKYAACAHLQSTELFLQIIWVEKFSCLLGKWYWDHLGLTVPLSVPHSHFHLSWEFFPWLSTCFVQAGMVMLYQLSALIARTDFEEMDTINNCSFHTHSKRLHPDLNKIKPSLIHSPSKELLQPFVSKTNMRTHLYTHLFTLTLFICSSMGLNITLNTLRSSILWHEAILKFLEALCWHRTSYYFPETQVTV